MRFALFLFAGSFLYGQAMVESGLGAARAATMSAPAAGIGKSISGLAESAGKAMSATPGSSVTQVNVVRSSVTRPATVHAAYADVRTAPVGTAYEDLIARFGPPFLEMTFDGGLERLTYPGRDGSTRVEIRDGKVASVEPPPSQK